jgi:hypothetical protein
MGTKRLITLLCLVAILGSVAIWNIDTMKEKRMAEMLEADMSLVNTVVPSQENPTMEAGAEEEVPVVPASPRASTGETPVATPPSSTIEGDMAALDTMFDAAYEDAALDTTFTSDGATTLSEPYDI